jgi:hypothetical protein
MKNWVIAAKYRRAINTCVMTALPHAGAKFRLLAMARGKRGYNAVVACVNAYSTETRFEVVLCQARGPMNINIGARNWKVFHSNQHYI